MGILGPTRRSDTDGGRVGGNSLQYPPTQGRKIIDMGGTRAAFHCDARPPPDEPQLQQAVNRQTHMRRTPILSFHADEVARGATRIEEILRELEIPEDAPDAGEPAPLEGDDAAPAGDDR